MSTTAETATAISPFHVDTPEEDLAELRRRIAATRLPTEELVADRSQGVQLATIKALAHHWETDYDWRKAEAKLNALPQFTSEIDGVDIHFIHVKSSHENALPLIMTHGWPGSVMEMIDSVGPLTDPTAHGGSGEDAFHLVLPSLPGYAFSGEPAEAGWDPARVRLLGGAGRGGLGPGPDRKGLGRAHGPPRPYPLRRPGRRRGGRGLGHARTPSNRGVDRHTHEPARAGVERRHADGYRRGARRRRADRHLPAVGKRLLRRDGRAAADDRLRPARLARRPGRLDARPRHRRLRQDRPRLRRWPALRQPHPGQRPGQHHGVLGDRHRRVRGPVVLGGLWGGRAGRGPRAASAAEHAGRLHDVPGRDLANPAQLGGEGLSQPQLLQRSREGRPLRRLGGARAVRGGDPRRVQAGPLTHPRRLPFERNTHV